MTAEEFSQFRHDCVHALKRLNNACDKAFQLPSWPRWDYDLDRGTLTFSKDGIPRVVASVLVVGTTSKSAGNWLWSWANGHFPNSVSEPMKRVRDFGLSEGLEALTEPYTPDDEYHGWEMTAIAARILRAKGAYRCPGNNGFTYLIYTDLVFAEQPLQSKDRKQISCDTHGTAYSTYVCEHLLADPRQEWFSSEPDEDNLWPDAWCATCEAFFQEQGEWNAANEKNIKIQLLCHFCYEKFRAQGSR